MRWLWYVGPIVVAVVFLLVALLPTRRGRRRKIELERWVEEFLGPLTASSGNYRKKPAPSGGDGASLSKRWVGRLPRPLQEPLQVAGGGTAVADVVLVPKLAYLAVRAADRVSSTDHQTVVARLGKPGPSMVVRPLPIVEGSPVDNRGVQFTKDPEFMDHFVVEGADKRAIIKWLRPSMREALLEFPDAWVRIQGRIMTVTFYGEADAERIDELVGTADALFAERGASGGPTLFGDEDTPQKKKRSKAKPEIATGLAPMSARLSAGILDAVLYTVAIALVIGVLALREGGWATVSVASILGPPPADPLDGAWQGGWTTKGFGALVAAECLLAGLFVYQTYLAARRGESIGKRLFGARIIGQGGERLSFWRAVLLRTWLIAAVPLAVGAVLTQPFDGRAYVMGLFEGRILLVALGAILLDLAPLFVGPGRRALHDHIARTQVIAAPKGLSRFLES